MSIKHSKDKDASSTWWFYQVQDNFFSKPEIRRLKRTTGDTGVMIFLQMILKSLRTDGYIERAAAELGETFIEELAYDLDRDPEEVETVVDIAKKLGLLVPVATNLFYFPDVSDNIKTLTRQARDNRRKRAEERAMQQSCGNMQQSCYNNNNNSEQQNNDNQNYFVCSEGLFSEEDIRRGCERERATAAGREAEAAPVAARSLSELMEVSQDHDIGLNQKGIEKFFKITDGGTRYGKKPMISVEGSMKHWAGVNREKHPEYFCDGASELSASKAEPAADDPEEEYPEWHPESSNYCDFDDDDVETVKDLQYLMSLSRFAEMRKEGEQKARENEGYHSAEWCEDRGKKYAMRRLIMDKVERGQLCLTNPQIACLMDEGEYGFCGLGDEEFLRFFMDRAKR